MLKGELFSTDMVRAYMEGRKLHTARPMKEPPPNVPNVKFREITKYGMARFEWDCSTNLCERKPKHRTGDYIYCRETWTPFCINKKTCRNALLGHSDYCLKASQESAVYGCCDGLGCKWHPSIHMPREAARLFFRVSRVEVMRLEDVTEEFAMEDGFLPSDGGLWSAKDTFKHFLLGTYGSDAHWMWVYWTESVTKEEAYANAQ